MLCNAAHQQQRQQVSKVSGLVIAITDKWGWWVTSNDDTKDGIVSLYVEEVSDFFFSWEFQLNNWNWGNNVIKMSPFFFLSKYINSEFHFYTETIKSNTEGNWCVPCNKRVTKKAIFFGSSALEAGLGFLSKWSVILKCLKRVHSKM